MKKEFKELKNLLPGLKENISLKKYTTFKIGGLAKYFYIAKTKQELISAIKTAKKHNLPFFILGGGSKLLISDFRYDGLVIKTENKEIVFNEEKNMIIAGAGVLLWDIVQLCLKEGLCGTEWFAGIPGVVGGSVRGNAAAFNGVMQDIVKKVEVFDAEALTIKKINNKECQFEVKNSIFKKNKDLIIVSAEFQLKKGNTIEIKEKVQKYLKTRNQNHPLDFASAGCIFINPNNASAGHLIDQCGLKGKTIGEAQISKKHANFIINLGNAKANDVVQLIELAKKEVKQKFGVDLEEEIQFVVPVPKLPSR